MLPRLRQAVLVARDLEAVQARLRAAFHLRPPFADPGVAEFGLDNAVFEVGDTFLEVVSPRRADAAAARYLDRAGEGGYMAIFQVADIAEARARARSVDARIVWQADLDDIAGMHLHPKDTPGAIVSLDEARPPRSWRWAGPRWIGDAPADAERGGVDGIVVAVDDEHDARRRWSAVLGGSAPATSFAPADRTRGVEGIVRIELTCPAIPTATVTIGRTVVVSR